jgi:hypothetical protein
MFLMTYLKFASNILSLDMGSFEKIHIVIVLGGKRLLWKPMGNHLVYSSLYWGSHFTTFLIFKPIDVANIIDFDNFIKMDAFGHDLLENNDWKCYWGPHEGCIVCGGVIFWPLFSAYIVWSGWRRENGWKMLLGDTNTEI